MPTPNPETDNFYRNLHRDSDDKNSSPRHVDKPGQMELVRNSNRGRRTITVLAENDVGFTRTRVITFDGIRPVEQDDHIRILLQASRTLR